MEVNGIQRWTIPKTGKYSIEAFGAGGLVGTPVKVPPRVVPKYMGNLT